MIRGYYTILIDGEAFASTEDSVFLQPVEGGPIIETVPMFGAAVPLHLNQGNVAVPRRYVITKEHATPGAAIAWEHDASATWGGVSTVAITPGVEGGVGLYWPQAKVEVAVTRRVGVTTTTTLTITGGLSEIPPS